MQEENLKRMMASIECSSCGQCYEESNIDVLGNYEDLWFMSVFCISCRAQYLVVVVEAEDKITEVISDLTEAEFNKFVNSDRLTADEVIDMHSFLQEFDGNFVRLFNKK